MGLGDQPGRYGPQSSGNRGQSTEAALASIEVQLENQGKLIEKISEKMDGVALAVAAIDNQMEHLVTKEACAEGRKDLADDLKARMDGDREITGMGITVPKLLQQYGEAITAQQKAASGPSSPNAGTTQKTEAVTVGQEPKNIVYYIRTVSAVLSLIFAVITITFFAYKMMDRLDRQQEVMQSIQQNLRTLDGKVQNQRSQDLASPPGIKVDAVHLKLNDSGDIQKVNTNR